MLQGSYESSVATGLPVTGPRIHTYKIKCQKERRASSLKLNYVYLHVTVTFLFLDFEISGMMMMTSGTWYLFVKGIFLLEASYVYTCSERVAKAPAIRNSWSVEN